MTQPTLTRFTLTALLLACVTVFVGCHRSLMRAPVMFDQTQADPFDALPIDQRQTTAKIFYATNREPAPDDRLNPYGNGRADALTLGRIDIEIGENMPWEELIDKTIGPLSGKRPPLIMAPPDAFGPLLTTAPPRVIKRATGENEKDVQVRFMARQDPGRAAFRFAEALNNEMIATEHAEIYVYIHGYRNSFADAMESAASLHHYNGRRGAVIAFSWPSQKHFLDYFEDRESATFAVSDLRQLLVFLADHTDAERINLVAHSMGTNLTSNTLREMRLIGYDQTPDQLRERFRIDNVVLVAPDIDVDVLQKRFFREGFHHVPRRLTIYTSPDDKALAWATRLLYGIVRAGSITGDYLTENQRLWLKANPSVSIIDISGQKTYGLGHSHHTENPGVASDLLLLLAHDLTPSQRGLVMFTETNVWGFPQGYTRAVQQIAEQYYPLRDEQTDGNATDVARAEPLHP